MDGLRDHFLLQPDVVFLNQGSYGACPRPVFESYQNWQLELERQPVQFIGRRAEGLLGEAREALGNFVGADPNDLVYVPNATTGLNTVARSLSLKPGDEVLTTDHEYGALNCTWEFICAKRGAHYIHQPVPLPVESPDQIVEAIWAGVTERTRVLFFSHISSPTALIFPAAQLVARAREAGIITVIDGAHAPGQLDLDLNALDADFYAGNCHKWMMTPKGSGFLHVRRSMQPQMEPLVVSWGWGREEPVVSPFIDSQQYQGTRDIAAYLAVPAAIQFMEDNDWPTARYACHELVRLARRQVATLTGQPPLIPDHPDWFAQMAVLPLSPCDGRELYRRLYEEFNVEIPITAWNDRQFARISVQGYNTREDVETLVRGLTTLLPEVAA